MHAATFTPPCYDAQADSYDSVQKWIEAFVRDFQRSYGGDRDELRQEAGLAFIHALSTWRPELSSFPTYLRMKMFSRLFGQYRTRVEQARWRTPTVAMGETEPPDKYFDTATFLAGLGDDAKTLAEMTIEEPGVLDVDSLWFAVKELGWTCSRFEVAFTEVRDNLL